MPVQFVASSITGLIQERQSDVYKMLHIAFDQGYLFEPEELENIWLNHGKGKWLPLPEKDQAIWYVLQKSLNYSISGDPLRE